MNPLLWMTLGVPLAVDLGAMVVCGLKAKRGFLVFGAVVVGLAGMMAVGMLLRWDVVWVEGWEDVMVGAAFLSFLLPTTMVLLVGALRLGRPGSWWVQRLSSDSDKRRALVRYGT